ncbi:MAG TPA: class I SAM-dependent RNA methyltransferase [Bryobacteraceae bacterium]|nr:class I SAM-dependent RNA methyltransferase [Bryobacteraceae bacterium]
MAAPLTNFELTIEKLVYGGEGLGRVEGQVALAPYVLPGERVRVERKSGKGGLLRTELREVLQPAPERVEPPCPYFARCGGCHYQHGSYALQLESKKSILRETLRRVGKVEAPEEIGVVAGEPWGYRNRSQFHVSGSSVGYLEARSHKLCAVTRCPISSPRVNEVLSALLGMARDPRWPSFLRSIEVFTNERETQLNVQAERPVARRFFDWCAAAVPGFAAGSIEYPAAGFTYRVGGEAFFQVNRFLLEDLIRTAIGDAGGGWAVDLYAGVGLFTLPLSKRFARVTAVESGAASVRDLNFNVQAADAPVQVARSASDDFLRALRETPDFVLADPPRTGLGRPAASRLAGLKPPRIAIVACDPATLARDLPLLLSGGYRIARLTLVDLFPQTFHLESVVELAL